jgi:DNA-binding NtrC family response regulator
MKHYGGDESASYEVTPGAMELLLSYNWPGNVREFQNAMERAMLLCEGGTISRSLFPFIESAIEESQTDISMLAVLPYREAMERVSASIQKQYLIQVLKMFGGNVTHAAEHAGIERESFHRLMRKCKVRSDDVRRNLEQRN